MMIDRMTEEEVKLRSYFIWEREGRPLGCSWEHWFRAKAELTAERPVPIMTPGIRQSRATETTAPAAAPPPSPSKKQRARKA